MSGQNPEYRIEHLAYFKDLINGNADVSWCAWWHENSDVLKDELTRAEYLRLKFGQVEYAYKVLKENGFECEWGAAAKRESYYACLHESVLDDRGKPREDLRRAAYDGACGDFLDGEADKGRQRLMKIIAALRGKASLEAKDELEEMQCDGEMMVVNGVDVEFGKAILEAVVLYGYGDDLTDHAVSEAEEILSQMEDL